MKQLKFALVAALALVAVPAYAQLGDLGNLVADIGDIVAQATPILVGIAVLVFFWGLVKFIFNAGDEEKRKEGRQVMIWGVVAIFVIVALLGLVRFIGDALGIEEEGGSIPVPGVQN